MPRTRISAQIKETLMGYDPTLAAAPGGRTEIEAQIREQVANPSSVPRRQHIVVPVTGAPVGKVEDGEDG